jgi:hypothetical protein
VYVGTIAGSIYTSRVTTEVCLGYVLTNIYPIAVVVVVMSVCQSLLWLGHRPMGNSEKLIERL